MLQANQHQLAIHRIKHNVEAAEIPRTTPNAVLFTESKSVIRASKILSYKIGATCYFAKRNCHVIPIQPIIRATSSC